MKWGMPADRGFSSLITTTTPIALTDQNASISCGCSSTGVSGNLIVGITTGGDTSGNVVLTFAQAVATVCDNKVLPGSCLEVVRFF